MDSKRDGPVIGALRTSDRLRQRRKMYGQGTFLYYKPVIRKKNKSKKRTAASQIAKILQTRDRQSRVSHLEPVAKNLRRSTRKRKLSINLEDYGTDSSRTDDDLMAPRYRSSRSKVEINASHDELSISPRDRKILNSKRLPQRENASHNELSAYPRSRRILNSNSLPRREGLRPRKSVGGATVQRYQQSEDEHESSEEPEEQEQEDQDEAENGNAVEDDGEDEADGDGGDEVEVDEDDEDVEEQDGRRRYDLRDRAEVRRSTLDKDGKQTPRRILHHGMGTKNNKDARKSGARIHKKHRFSRADDSDDSLLVDELDEGPIIPWMRSGKSGAPWLFGGLDMHGTSAWGLNVAASGWAHQGDTFASLTSGVQTAGPSSKGGADVQPLQVDESISFDDIGGLSEYVDALKEMVFFPLLYPDFFANYSITPPRGVLLCGPPGTGKTLIARALACAASKAGQKVSFYMRKGADVLSKWVGEAERQLKLLFEEAQKNQPSIIFFDEIDGLAPVRSSKQEQIHNSIVSTLLALMDGLDSRGQVVLIGATNRIDAIDGALRRPGRFDREFNFPLPGCKARAEILDIHTRKWKEPPSEELKAELAASCVGYCGADLKALCTEAAIRAFREKYPQVYTSDEKFVIDVNSINVQQFHFLEAMSTITPAAHRGSIVHSRPLSPIVSSFLQIHVQRIMKHIADIFPFLLTSDISKLSVFSYGPTIPLVYRPRLLICGDESSGLDHIGPAILHELEKFPVHSLGLPSLLSDPSAKTPEEALVHIFSEARRTSPSVLFLPQFQLWWETAHQQLKAVLMTLLEELPSQLPIILLGTSSEPLSELDGDSTYIFSPRNVYTVDRPTLEDRSKFVDQVAETIFTVPKVAARKSKEPDSVPELQKAPKEPSGPKTSELKAKAEAEQHALRRLRMCLRDVCNRILYDKRFSMFHYPVSDEDAPNYRSIIQNPIDMATILQKVDSGQYPNLSLFVQDIDLIVMNAKVFNGDDYNGARIVSKAYELRDVVQGMLSQMDPSLISCCDKIAAQGGPVHMPDDVGGLGIPSAPVVQITTVTRSSARLRHAQPEVNLSQSYEALKKPRKNVENELPVSTAEDKSKSASETEPSNQTTTIINSAQEAEANESQNPPDSELTEASGMDARNSQGEFLQESEINNTEIAEQIRAVKDKLIERSENYGVPQLERLYCRLIRSVLEVKIQGPVNQRLSILRHLLQFVEDEENF
ncbi:ATPase family AAA domain-containing protein At1g05910 [Phalaenopsis equestris]|uniref:ATPase family AAA domain-containing protein At1g05910 n=1 Tax=Phalaenopsis equestris TaxID=78828 RepID=UPI0009E1FC50|nr:ATPase family AAA domain-containing protein At1g05910 [Phalaenopsis equestris]XP_020587183.1 ATPase family AAA domain-containing protein At1g05910 [Phalaenopsis equestris]